MREAIVVRILFGLEHRSNRRTLLVNSPRHGLFAELAQAHFPDADVRCWCIHRTTGSHSSWCELPFSMPTCAVGVFTEPRALIRAGASFRSRRLSTRRRVLLVNPLRSVLSVELARAPFLDADVRCW
jgi:hypothetical protein